MLIVGTAVVPLTAFIVFLFVPAFGSAASVALSAFNLLLLIGIATASAFTLRYLFWREATPNFLSSVDGLSAIVMCGIVIGLMTAVGPALRGEPLEVLFILALACAASFGLQIGAYLLLAKSSTHGTRVGHSIISGCRNNALFISALPLEVTDPLLLYIGCYQIPMYLTPLLLRWLYDPAGRSKSHAAKK